MGKDGSDNLLKGVGASDVFAEYSNKIYWFWSKTAYTFSPSVFINSSADIYDQLHLPHSDIICQISSLFIPFTRPLIPHIQHFSVFLVFLIFFKFSVLRQTPDLKPICTHPVNPSTVIPLSTGSPFFLPFLGHCQTLVVGLCQPCCSLIPYWHVHTYVLSTLQGLQTLDPFTDMYTYTGMCLAHPLDIVNTFWYHCQLGSSLVNPDL